MKMEMPASKVWEWITKDYKYLLNKYLSNQICKIFVLIKDSFCKRNKKEMQICTPFNHGTMSNGEWKWCVWKKNEDFLQIIDWA